MIISFVVFDDEDDAIKFHQEMVDPDTNNLTGYGILAGSYKFPTRYCNGEEPYSHKREGWTFLQKRGWWVCPICKRPSKPLGFSLTNYGHNIMDKIKQATLGDTL
jgi:hypothetical protein